MHDCVSSYQAISGTGVFSKKVLFSSPLLRRRYFAFNSIDFDSLGSACQISKSRQNIRGSGCIALMFTDQNY